MSVFRKRNTCTLSAALVAATFTSLAFAAGNDSMSGTEASTSQQPMAGQMAPAEGNARSTDRERNAQASTSMNRGATQQPAMSRTGRWSEQWGMARSAWPASPNESESGSMGR